MSRNKLVLIIIIYITLLFSFLAICWAFMTYVLPVDSDTIKAYRTQNYANIIVEIMDVSFKETYTTFSMEIGSKKAKLTTAFYHLVILNPEVIDDFLNKIQWADMIKEHKFDLTSLEKSVFEEYKLFLETIELEYNSRLNDDYAIIKHKRDVRDFLCEFLDDEDLPEEFKQQISNIEFLDAIIEQIDWKHYVKSQDCYTKQYEVPFTYFCDIISMLFDKYKVELYNSEVDKKLALIYYYNSSIDKFMTPLIQDDIVPKVFIYALLHSNCSRTIFKLAKIFFPTFFKGRIE